METKDIGRINNFANNCISVILDYAGDDNAELMEKVRISVQHDEYGYPYILAEDVMDLLKFLAKKSQERPIENLYSTDEYNY